jgi:hypothetical protein
MRRELKALKRASIPTPLDYTKAFSQKEPKGIKIIS